MGKSYNGYMLSANCDASRLASLKSGFSKLADQLATVIDAAQGKYDDLVSYAAADPSVPVALDSSCLGTISSRVSQDSDEVFKNIEVIINAIADYQDGNWSDPANKEYIDRFLSENGKNPEGGASNGGSGGDSGGGGGPSAESDDTLESNEEIIENIESTVPLEDTTTTNDEEIVLGQVDGVAGEYNAEAVVPFTGEDEELTIAEDEIDSNSSLGTSLFGNGGTLSIPSMIGSTGEVDGIKGASVLGAAGIAAAAAAAIGGKVFYDKKHDTDEDSEEEFDEDISKISEESGSDVNSGFMSGLNSVDFKNELLNEMDGDE